MDWLSRYLTISPIVCTLPLGAVTPVGVPLPQSACASATIVTTTTTSGTTNVSASANRNSRRIAAQTPRRDTSQRPSLLAQQRLDHPPAALAIAKIAIRCPSPWASCSGTSIRSPAVAAVARVSANVADRASSSATGTSSSSAVA